MKTITDTPDLLVLEDFPRLRIAAGVAAIVMLHGLLIALAAKTLAQALTVVLFGVPFLAAFLLIFARRTQIALDAHQGLVTIHNSSVRGRRETRINLAHVGHANTETIKTPRQDECHRLALDIPYGQHTGQLPVTSAYQSGNGPARAAETINRWLTQLRGDQT